jgi:hypothetical protein
MRRAGAIVAALLALALGDAVAAPAEVGQTGNAIVDFSGGISPRALPRTEPAPVAVRVDADVAAANGADPPPQLQQISIAINRNGRLFDRGLPTCRVHRIQPSTIAAARRICGGAIVGSGHVQVRVALTNQPLFTFEGPLLVFNAKRSGGHRRLLAQVYGTNPPSAFVLTFKVFRQKGAFGTVIKTTLPRPAREWAYVTHFDMRLRRIYTYHGRQHSFVTAACEAPPGFPGAIFPFARGSFAFGDGTQVGAELVRNCSVRS